MLTREYIRRVQRMMDQTNEFASANARFALMDTYRAKVDSESDRDREFVRETRFGELMP